MQYKFSKAKIFSVYGIVNPMTKEIIYVGKSKAPERRLAGHLRKPTNLKMRKALNKIKSAGLKPTLIVLQKCTALQVFHVEKKWISDLSNKGFKLNNILLR